MDRQYIQLPPLPDGDIYADTCPPIKVHTDQQLQGYARLAIEPYKKRIAELESQLKASTADELLELDEMKIETKPFDLERALAGEPVVTRQGDEVIQLTLFKTNGIYKLAGVVKGELLRFTPTGKYFVNESHELDLFMKVKTHKVNGFEVPAPVTNPENMKSGITYYVADNTYLEWYFGTTWENDEEQKAWITRNLVFMNKEDAIANAKAMSGVNPYGGCND